MKSVKSALPRPLRSALRRFIETESSSGIILMLCAALAIAVANSPWATIYHQALHAKIAGIAVEAWINDALMSLFFMLVGLEIKREFLHGRLRTWPARILPGMAALGGMIQPAIIYAAFNWTSPESLGGWAIPAATDIAFALGVLSLLGSRVPAALKVFVTALAVLDDLGAVVIIALFYTAGLSLPLLGGAALIFAALVALNRTGHRQLWAYLLLGFVMWVLVWRSGVHATVAGVLLALTIPASAETPGNEDDEDSPLHVLEQALAPWVAFAILPVFAFANAGVVLGAGGFAALAHPVTMGVAAGLFLGKQIGVFAAVWIAIQSGLVKLPGRAGWAQIYGVAVLCGIGFTMSLFIGHLAFAHQPDLIEETKLGVLIGSIASAVLGALILTLSSQPPGGQRGEPRKG